jgi:hypothetical protein
MASSGLPADWRHPENHRFSEEIYALVQRRCFPLKMRTNSSIYQ